MKYYIFKVRTHDERLPEFYIINNVYIGYVGFDSQHVRSIIEGGNQKKFEFQHVASGDVAEDRELHNLFCESKRLNRKSAEELIEKYKLKPSGDSSWYKVYRPDKNSTKSHLRSVMKKKNGDTLIKEIK